MKHNRLVTLGSSIVATSSIIALLLLVSSYNPIQVFYVLVSSTWGSYSGFLQVLTKTTLLILTGLAVAIPYRAGLFNIGGEGQFLLGALMAAWIGSLPLAATGPFHMLIGLLAGTLVGGCWGWQAGWLKTSRGIHEVISTIMLNFIAFHFVNELTYSVLSGGENISRTAFIEATARIPVMISNGASHTSWAIMAALSLAVMFSWFLYSTWPGYYIRAVGSNPVAVRYAGHSVGRIQNMAMTLGGCCAGFAGAIQIAGIDHTFYARFAGGYGFDGIAVSFLALNEPWATIPASLAIATLRAADRSLQLDAGVPRELVYVIEGILIICIAIFTRWRAHE